MVKPKKSEALTDQEQIDYTTKVMLRAVDDCERLKNGIRLRAEMHAAQKRGEAPSGYRAEWVQKVVLRVIKTLSTSAEEFNATHHDDKISLDDFSDILHTVTKRLGI